MQKWRCKSPKELKVKQSKVKSKDETVKKETLKYSQRVVCNFKVKGVGIFPSYWVQKYSCICAELWRWGEKSWEKGEKGLCFSSSLSMLIHTAAVAAAVVTGQNSKRKVPFFVGVMRGNWPSVQLHILMIFCCVFLWSFVCYISVVTGVISTIRDEVDIHLARLRSQSVLWQMAYKKSATEEEQG